ncbi:MAG: hypothetical protein IKY15_01175 [Clostridia bacterium]|nr:hypothetical protein [Clostridia bacterium]
MKKILPFALACLIMVPLASACNPTTEHKDVYKEWTAFAEDASYAEFFAGNILFSDDIQSAKVTSTSPFHTLTYCETLIKASLQNVDLFSDVFLLVPDHNQNSIRTLCSDVLIKLDNFKEEIGKFRQEKNRLENQIEIHGGTSSTAAVAELDDFLLDIGNLTISANNLQISFNNAFTKLYSLPIDRELSGDALDIKASVSTVQSLLIDDCITYSIKEFNGYHPDETTRLYNAVKNLNAKMASGTAIGTNYATWLESYRLFKAEDNMFKSSINRVDLTKDNSNLTGENLNHYNLVQSFVTENAYLFAQKTIDLLY